MERAWLDTVARLARAREAARGTVSAQIAVAPSCTSRPVAPRAATVPLSRVVRPRSASMCAQVGALWVFHDEAPPPTALALASVGFGAGRRLATWLPGWDCAATPMRTSSRSELAGRPVHVRIDGHAPS